MSSVSPDLFAEMGQLVTSWRRPLLLSHTKPDGDALGSLTALAGVLRAQGADPLALLYDALPNRYALATTYHALPVLGREVNEAELASVDGVVLLDTCSYAQLSPMADWLQSATVPKLAVDHHLTRDPIVDYSLVDESAAATCLILYDWFRAVDWAISPAVRDSLVIGIATDTGWFRHPNTDERVFAAMLDLTRRGAQAAELFHQLYHRDSLARLRLRTVALASLELYLDDRLAVLTVTPETMQRVGAEASDTEEIINEPLRVGSVVVSVLLVAREDGQIRVSFRSKEPLTPGDPDVDVAAVAAGFGGGGHRRAAGARLTGTIHEARRAVLDRMEVLLPTDD